MKLASEIKAAAVSVGGWFDLVNIPQFEMAAVKLWGVQHLL